MVTPWCPRLQVDRSAFGCGEVKRPGDAVAAEIHELTAVEDRAHPNVLHVLPDEAERRAYDAHPADGPLADQLLHLGSLRVMAEHERLHQHETRPLGEVERLLD